MSNYSAKRPILGIFFMFTGILIYSLLNLLIKDLGCRYSILQITFFRTSIAIIPALIMLHNYEPTPRFRTPDNKRLIVLGLILMASIWLIFQSFTLLKVAQAQTLCFTSILFVTALAPFILKEHLTWIRILAVITGFTGVVAVAQPSGEGINLWGVLTALLFALTDAVVLINLRIIGGRNSSYKTAFFLMLYATLWVGLVYMMMPWLPENIKQLFSLGWQTPTHDDLIWLVALGLGGGIGQICVANAFRLAPATVVSPLIYMGVVWGLVFDWAFYNNVPTVGLLTGASLTIISGLMIVFEDKIKLHKLCCSHTSTN